MPTLYRVRAHESDTHIDRIDLSTPSSRVATHHAQRLAATYYGDRGATWVKSTGTDRYLVGRFYDDGYREMGTCVISVEAYDSE